MGMGSGKLKAPAILVFCLSLTLLVSLQLGSVNGQACGARMCTGADVIGDVDVDRVRARRGRLKDPGGAGHA